MWEGIYEEILEDRLHIFVENPEYHELFIYWLSSKWKLLFDSCNEIWSSEIIYFTFKMQRLQTTFEI